MKTFGPLFHTKRSQTNDIVLQDDVSNLTSDKARIAQLFNDYFTNVAASIYEPDVQHFGNDFMNHPSISLIKNHICTADSPAFNFSSVHPGFVSDIILALSTSKAMGHDNIPIRLIKDGLNAIATPLTNLFNFYLTVDDFPACWKYGQVTPIFKKVAAFSAIRVKIYKWGKQNQENLTGLPAQTTEKPKPAKGKKGKRGSHRGRQRSCSSCHFLEPANQYRLVFACSR